MRIAFDLHGVLTESPQVMRPMLTMLKRLGAEIHILSGPKKEEILDELEALGYKIDEHFDKVFSIVDHVKSKDVEMWKDEKDTYWCADEEWWPTKGNYCAENWIDYIFDDREGYKENMPKKTKFFLVGGDEACQ